MEQLTVASSDIQSGARSFAASSVISGAVGMSAHVISGRPIEVPPGIPAAAIVLVFFANGCIISRPSARGCRSRPTEVHNPSTRHRPVWWSLWNFLE